MVVCLCSNESAFASFNSPVLLHLKQAQSRLHYSGLRFGGIDIFCEEHWGVWHLIYYLNIIPLLQFGPNTCDYQLGKVHLFPKKNSVVAVEVVVWYVPIPKVVISRVKSNRDEADYRSEFA